MLDPYRIDPQETRPPQPQKPPASIVEIIRSLPESARERFANRWLTIMFLLGVGTLVVAAISIVFGRSPW